jgi:alanine dehydrogenase
MAGARYACSSRSSAPGPDVPLILSESDVIGLLSVPDSIRVVEESFRLYASGRAAVAPRMALKLTGEAGAFRVMAASVPEMGVFGLKTLTGIPGRRRAGSTYFAMLLFDATTGALTALIAATHITGVRTGAAGATAVKHLARPDSRVLGVLGAGFQARAQMNAIREVRHLELVKIFDVDASRAAAAAEALEAAGTRARVAPSSYEAVKDSDIVVSATTSTEPVIHGEWLTPGMHVNAIGANSPAKRELDVAALMKGRLVVDFREQVIVEDGDIVDAAARGVLPADMVETELGQVITGDKDGRRTAADITIFKSVGVAFQDVAVAAWVYRRAKELGIGTIVPLERESLEAV